MAITTNGGPRGSGIEQHVCTIVAVCLLLAVCGLVCKDMIALRALPSWPADDKCSTGHCDGTSARVAGVARDSPADASWNNVVGVDTMKSGVMSSATFERQGQMMAAIGTAQEMDRGPISSKFIGRQYNQFTDILNAYCNRGSQTKTIGVPPPAAVPEHALT